jgi:transposase InsO family protein
VIVAYLDEHKGRFGVEPVCAVLKDAGVQIAPSTYYAAKTRPPAARSISDAATTTLIKRLHADNFGVYGARKVHAELRRQGHPVARCTVARLMRAAGLRGVPHRACRVPGAPGNGAADTPPGEDRQTPCPPRTSCVERRRPQGPAAATRSASGRSLPPTPPVQRARQPGGEGRKKINSEHGGG